MLHSSNGSICFGRVTIAVTLRPVKGAAEPPPENLLVGGARFTRGRSARGRMADRRRSLAPRVLLPLESRRGGLETVQRIEILDLVDPRAIGGASLETPCTVEPVLEGDHGVVILRKALERAGRVAVVKVSRRSRLYLGALMSRGDELVLDLFDLAHELRAPAGFWCSVS